MKLGMFWALALAGCVSRAGPVVTKVYPIEGGGVAYEQCELSAAWSPFGADVDLGDCKRVRKEAP